MFGRRNTADKIKLMGNRDDDEEDMMQPIDNNFINDDEQGITNGNKKNNTNTNTTTTNNNNNNNKEDGDEDEEEEEGETEKEEKVIDTSPIITKEYSGNTEDLLNALEQLHRGTAMFRHNHWHYYQVSHDNTRMQWYSNTKTLSETCVYLDTVSEIKLRDESTATTTNQGSRIFSLVYSEPNKPNAKKELVLHCKTPMQCQIWIKTLQKLVAMNKNEKDREKEKKEPTKLLTIDDITYKEYYDNGAYVSVNTFSSMSSLSKSQGGSEKYDKQYSEYKQLSKSELEKLTQILNEIELMLSKHKQLGEQPTVVAKIKEIRQRAEKLEKEKDIEIENVSGQLEYIKMLKIETIALKEKMDVLLYYLGTDRRKRRSSLFNIF